MDDHYTRIPLNLLHNFLSLPVTLQLYINFLFDSDERKVLLSSGVFLDLFAPEPVAGLSLLVDLELLEESECLALCIPADLSSHLVLHPLVGVLVLPRLVLLRELQLLQGLHLIFNQEIGRSIYSTQIFVGLGTDKRPIQNVWGLNLEDLPLITLLTDSSKNETRF